MARIQMGRIRAVARTSEYKINGLSVWPLSPLLFKDMNYRRLAMVHCEYQSHGLHMSRPFTVYVTALIRFLKALIQE